MWPAAILIGLILAETQLETTDHLIISENLLKHLLKPHSDWLSAVKVIKHISWTSSGLKSPDIENIELGSLFSHIKTSCLSLKIKVLFHSQSWKMKLYSGLMVSQTDEVLCWCGSNQQQLSDSAASSCVHKQQEASNTQRAACSTEDKRL